MKRIALAAVLAVFALAPAALAAGTLTGTYKTTIKSSQFGGHLNGKWKLKLTSGHYKAWQNGKLIVKGSDTVTPKTVSLTDTGGPGKCTGTGVYKYSLRHDKLTFSRVSDGKSCAGREFVLKHTFHKVS